MNNSVIEKISSINRSGISNNMMAYRLSLLMRQAQDKSITTATENQVLTQERQEELSGLLSQSPLNQNIEDFRQKLKEKYYLEYLNRFESKFSIEKQETKSQQDTPTRIERLISQKKLEFSKIQQSKLEKLDPNNQKTSAEIPTRSPEQDESTKKLLVPAIMGLVVAKGQNTDERTRIYEGVRYKLQLLMKEGMQFLSINRNGKPEKAFSAYKDEKNTEFRILENNLTDQEAKGIIEFNQQRITLENQNQLQHKDNNPELGD
ncbi:hypothetical protein IQ243_20500 [Nostocales cyanobacterium LEGE 11386]|nr:hypothetical protein [Nostocales cyanobacterium LEGE 11386]